jgi:hypothetical protein
LNLSRHCNGSIGLVQRKTFFSYCCKEPQSAGEVVRRTEEELSGGGGVGVGWGGGGAQATCGLELGLGLWVDIAGKSTNDDNTLEIFTM